MAKPMAPSRTLLSTFSRCLKRDASSFFPFQCKQFSSLRASAPLRTTNQSCPRTSIPCRASKQARNSFSSSATQAYKTVQEQRSRYRSGPFSWKAGLLFLSSGAGLIFYFRYEKERMERKRVAEATKGIGKPKVGGPFELLDQNGNKFTDRDMKGKYSLVYFGFSHCPDICPEELDKMAQMIDLVRASPLYQKSSTPPLLPIFITCDPARDTPAVLAEYLSEFHPSLVGLTGTWEQIKGVCKSYRVYFSTPSGVKKGQDYLVDHSIYFYLMDPEGDFVEAIGRQHSPEQAAAIILGHVRDWESK